MLVSVTRLHLRSLTALLPFLRDNERAVSQLLEAPGFVCGKLLVAGARTYWTITLWRDEASMRAYRSTGAHNQAMAKLAGWCDEASVVHWTQDETELPSWSTAHQRMIAAGRPSRVNHPSARHSSGVIPAPRVLIQRPLAFKNAAVRGA